MKSTNRALNLKLIKYTRTVLLHTNNTNSWCFYYSVFYTIACFWAYECFIILIIVRFSVQKVAISVKRFLIFFIEFILRFNLNIYRYTVFYDFRNQSSSGSSGATFVHRCISSGFENLWRKIRWPFWSVWQNRTIVCKLKKLALFTLAEPLCMIIGQAGSHSLKWVQWAASWWLPLPRSCWSILRC